MPDPIIRSGDLRHRITIESRSTANDNFGDPVETWSTVGEYWCHVRPATGREQMVAGQMQAEISHAIVMRYQGTTAITPNMRVQYGQRTFNIQSVINADGRNYMYTLYCIENVDARLIALSFGRVPRPHRPTGI